MSEIYVCGTLHGYAEIVTKFLFGTIKQLTIELQLFISISTFHAILIN